MTGADFKTFLFRHSLTQEAAAACLGRSKRSIAGYTEMDWVPRVVSRVFRTFGLGWAAPGTDSSGDGTSHLLVLQ